MSILVVVNAVRIRAHLHSSELYSLRTVRANVQTWCHAVYTVLYVCLSSVVGLCCKIDYNLEVEVKIMTFELCFMRCGNFLGGSGNVIWEWEGNGNEIQQSWEWEWEWELLHGYGRERESKTHSRTPLLVTTPQ